MRASVAVRNPALAMLPRHGTKVSAQTRVRGRVQACMRSVHDTQISLACRLCVCVHASARMRAGVAVRNPTPTMLPGRGTKGSTQRTVRGRVQVCMCSVRGTQVLCACWLCACVQEGCAHACGRGSEESRTTNAARERQERQRAEKSEGEGAGMYM